MKFLEKFCPCKYVVEDEPSTLEKVGKGIAIGLGVIAGIAAVFTAVELILVKFFKKCITITVQCNDLSCAEEENVADDEVAEDVEDEVAEEEAVEEPVVEQ